MIKITADSTCDLSVEIADDLNITLVPLLVLIGDEAFRDGVDIKPADIFKSVFEN
jgi:fatty acid-binding protein DegV